VDCPNTPTHIPQQTLSLVSESNDPTSIRSLSTCASQGKGSPFPSQFSNLISSKQHILPLSYRNQIEARKLLSWPAVRNILENDLTQIPAWDGESDGGERWLWKVSRAYESPLPADEPMNFIFVNGNTAPSWQPNTVVLTTNIVQDLCQTYFSSFHCLFPILDTHNFYAVTLPQAYATTFNQYDGCSTLVLLVLALGSVAQEGVSGSPIVDETTGRDTGVRGGTPQRPPGLVFFNEARRRVGIAISAYDVTMLQCLILFS
jgi:hypothetical protein